MKAVFAHSQVPLVLIPLIGAGLFGASILALIALTIDFVTRGVPFPGFGTIVALMVMLFGILFCLLGIVSIYIGLIYEEVKGRPNFVVRQTIGFAGLQKRAELTDIASQKRGGDDSAGPGVDNLRAGPEARGGVSDHSTSERDSASASRGS